jgi:hypothetical protein
LHSTRSYGRANSAFSWKLLVLERGFLSYRLKLLYDRSEKDAWFGYSPVGALRKLPFILYSRPAEDWLRRSGSSSTISPTTLFSAITARGRRNCSRSSTRRGSREYATTPASMPPPLRHLSRKPRYSGGPARYIEFGIPQMIYSRTSDRFRLGFRMPARREQSTRARTEGRRPKASEERTRGTAASSWPAMGIWSRRGVGRG